MKFIFKRDYDIWKTEQQKEQDACSSVFLWLFSLGIICNCTFMSGSSANFSKDNVFFLSCWLHMFTSLDVHLCLVWFAKYLVTKSRAWRFHRKCLMWNFALEVCFSLQLWSIWHLQSYNSNNDLQLNKENASIWYNMTTVGCGKGTSFSYVIRDLVKFKVWWNFPNCPSSVL